MVKNITPTIFASGRASYIIVPFFYNDRLFLSIFFTGQWRSLGLFSSEAIHQAQRGEKMLGGVRKLKKKMGD
jgi:hypothetical protein